MISLTAAARRPALYCMYVIDVRINRRSCPTIRLGPLNAALRGLIGKHFRMRAKLELRMANVATGLGLDPGANSLGWGILELEPKVLWNDARPIGIFASGVRIFDAGVEGSIKQGKDSSRGATRRLARQPRRRHWRRQFRKARLFRILRQLHHLPPTEGRSAEVRGLALCAQRFPSSHSKALNESTRSCVEHNMKVCR
jgi:hypothetical protein